MGLCGVCMTAPGMCLSDMVPMSPYRYRAHCVSLKALHQQLRGMSHLNYATWLKVLGLETLELRRLQHDLIRNYEILLEMWMQIILGCTLQWHTQQLGATCGNFIYITAAPIYISIFCKRCCHHHQQQQQQNVVIAPWNLLKITNKTLHSVTAFK